MWTSTIELSPRRILLTKLLGRFWNGAYFSSFAPLQVQNVPRQILPSPRWVRVRNRLAGVCGSDLHLIYTDGDIRVAPAALPGHRHSYIGHEVVGEVIEKGDDVQHLEIGDRVVLQHGPNCLSSHIQPLCRSCANGNYGLCERGNLPGPHPIGGGWSEEMLLHEQQLFRVPPTMSDEQAVLLEPTAVAVHAVLRRPPQNGERILIIGAGTIGLLTLQVVRALAPQAEISVQARYPFQVEKATRMGAAHIIYAQDSYAEVQRATNGQLYYGLFNNTMLMGGYDVIYDTIGNKKTLHNALRWTRAKGTIVLVGVSLHLMHIDLTPVWYQEVNLIGTMGQGMEQWPIESGQQRSTFSITAEMIAQEQLHPQHLVTHRFALDNYRNALLTAADKGQSRAIKVVFDYALLPASVVPNVRASAAQKCPTTIDTISPLINAHFLEEDEQEKAEKAEHPMPVATPSQVLGIPTTPLMPLPIPEPELLAANVVPIGPVTNVDHTNDGRHEWSPYHGVVGASFMAPVVGMHNIGDVDYPDDGRDQSGPYHDLATALTEDHTVAEPPISEAATEHKAEEFEPIASSPDIVELEYVPDDQEVPIDRIDAIEEIPVAPPIDETSYEEVINEVHETKDTTQTLLQVGAQFIAPTPAHELRVGPQFIAPTPAHERRRPRTRKKK